MARKVQLIGIANRPTNVDLTTTVYSIVLEGYRKFTLALAVDGLPEVKASE